MKSTVFFILSLLTTNLLTATTLDKPSMTVYEAINKAGYQRMLTQRIAKCYLTIALGIDASKHQRHLDGSVRVFEDNLERLSEYAPTLQIGHQFDEIEQLWTEYQGIYNQAYNLENAAQMLEFSNKILVSCNNAVILLEQYAIQQEQAKESSDPQEHLQLSVVINISGHQRMYSQRMLLYALALNYELGDQTINIKRFRTAMQTLNESYTKLLNYANNNEETREQLGLIATNWEKLKQQLLVVTVSEIGSEQRKKELLKALEMSESILFASDELVFLYQRLQD